MNIEEVLRQNNLLYQIEKELISELEIDLEDLNIIKQVHGAESKVIELKDVFTKLKDKKGRLNIKTKTLYKRGLITKKRDIDDERKVILTIEDNQLEDVEILINYAEDIIKRYEQ
ncbi:transcriptional regulator, SarA/Rot family [Mammaliicoccus sciuri]|uniref:Transcriptional regulator SarA/SarZ/Rot-like helix-turn-helix domain-containing protein n=1 Tax=Mammaliicoccus sciuri TaxID=1296 RepID=A0AAW5LR64_MAMSC|nr:hypothetical protein [Mammaliicoccus sciuri]MCQ9304919.1 hypothetical protein [Mammaliicoccus sciuri]PTJ52523.1 hypothetical protein BU012_04825 [Mammaliicoccus sciuri]